MIFRGFVFNSNQYVIQYFSSTVRNRGLICKGAIGALAPAILRKIGYLHNVGKIIPSLSTDNIKILTRSLHKHY